jgi:hypothetical protein
MRSWPVLAVGLALAGCGGGDGPAFEGAPLEQQDPGPVHVHGLGIDPADGSLFIATHTGLFRAPVGSIRAERVGDLYQDTMGFAVAGPGRFIGSGHPDLRENLPPLLGLIESRDAGKTWKSISLLGVADFHVLRSAGRFVYGFDSSNERLLVSRDRGRSWAERRAPEPLGDLVPQPGDPETAIAAGSVLHRTTDAGRSFTAIGGEGGYLAWPRTDRLFQLIGTGHVRVSTDQGETWRTLGSIGGEPAAFLAVSPDELYAALHDGQVKVSRDGGRTWSVRSQP